jgi:hypothetical protein
VDEDIKFVDVKRPFAMQVDQDNEYDRTCSEDDQD